MSSVPQRPVAEPMWAAALTSFALDHMRKQGVDIAVVETGGDPGHAPARATDEATGFTRLPVARYFPLLPGDPARVGVDGSAVDENGDLHSQDNRAQYPPERACVRGR